MNNSLESVPLLNDFDDVVVQMPQGSSSNKSIGRSILNLLDEDITIQDANLEARLKKIQDLWDAFEFDAPRTLLTIFNLVITSTPLSGLTAYLRGDLSLHMILVTNVALTPALTYLLTKGELKLVQPILKTYYAWKHHSVKEKIESFQERLVLFQNATDLSMSTIAAELPQLELLDQTRKKMLKAMNASQLLDFKRQAAPVDFEKFTKGAPIQL